MTRSRVAAPLVLVGLLAGTATVHARPEPYEPRAQAGASDVVPPAVLEQRSIVLDPQAEVGRIAAAATHLLAGKDLDTLRTALAGEAQAPALGVLQSLGVASAESVEPLLEDVVSLAARHADGPERRAADTVLDRLLAGAATGAAAPPRVRRMLDWVKDPLLDRPRRVVVLAALGRSAELAYVDPLVAALTGDSPVEVRAALTALTRHDLGPGADGPVWRAWWAEHSRYTREELLEQALEARNQELQSLRDEHGREQAAMETKLVAQQIAQMGDSVEGLLVGLVDMYPAVRQEAARRLALKPNDERAATAVPVLLARLGHGPANGNGNGHAAVVDPAAAAAAGRVETDPRVRAALVTALGELGRTRVVEARPESDVLSALAAELDSPHPAISAAAAAALEQFRNQPAVVRPLLRYLARLQASGQPEAVDTMVKALLAIAANAPSSIVPELLAFAEPSQETSVRAAAVRALMACDDIRTVLHTLAEIYSQDTSADVRFSIAASLGDRFARLRPEDEEVRTHMVGLLGNLLGDTEASVRAAAAEALGRSGSRSALTLLSQRARIESAPTVQQRLVGALGALRQPEAAPVIGTLVVARQGKEGQAELVVGAQQALSLMAGDRAPEPWVAAAESLDAVGAHGLAAYCCREARRLFSTLPEHRETVARAIGLLALELLHDGQAREARALLEELEASNAPFPSRDARLLALAEACEMLEDWRAQAEWLALHLRELPAGDGARDPETLATVRALHRAGAFVEAAALLRPFVESHPDDHQSLFDLAIVEEKLGQFEQAAFHLDRLLERPGVGESLRAEVGRARERVAGHLGAAPASSSATEGPRLTEPGAPQQDTPPLPAVGEDGTDASP